ncbi:YezD family protein [Cellvibrio sp. UBA7661]|uniref:YezD family protein n=1 Tax=Cellvibrio sp. UBA7661 TaxID=1946311 RepID=UPI002F358952
MGIHRSEIANSIDDVLAEVKRQLAHIRYGSVEIQIHNGQVVQLESREKKRWDKGVNVRQ